jgi:hypothetical protein
MVTLTLFIGIALTLGFLHAMSDMEDYNDNWDYDASWHSPWHEWAPVKALPWDLVFDVNDEVVARANARDGLVEDTFVEHEPYAPTFLILEQEQWDDELLNHIDWDDFEEWVLESCDDSLDESGSDWSTFFGQTVYDDVSLDEDWQVGRTWIDPLLN